MFLKRRGYIRGFTLIELSIVLVIIGLLVGGVLVGQSLISAAEVRAQITQIDKYNAAVNTFKGRFNALPGDMNAATAGQFGFFVGTGCSGSVQGYRDGNGMIDGGNGVDFLYEAVGETGLFWQDLSSAAGGMLIEDHLPNGNAVYQCGGTFVSGPTVVSQWFPVAKIGHANYVYVYEDGESNWFGISQITQTLHGGELFSNPAISVMQAYKIDAKIDDGLPTTGNVISVYLNTNAITDAPSAASDTSSSCYNTTTDNYSITYNSGTGGNCALSFRFQ